MKQMKHVFSLLLAVALIVSAVPVLGLRANAANEAVVEIAAASGSMNLTELGNADWMHFTGKKNRSADRPQGHLWRRYSQGREDRIL